MKKSIFIKKNKIIKEDALDQVSKDLKLGDILSSALDILKSTSIVTVSLLDDIVTGVKLASTYAFMPKKFDEILKDAKDKRRDLNNEWKNVMSNLGVDKPIEEFLNIVGPGSGFANTYLNKLSTRYASNSSGFIGTLTKSGKDFTSIGEELLGNIFGKKSVDDGSVKTEAFNDATSKNIQQFHKWIQELDPNKTNQFYQWASSNPDDMKELLDSLSKKDYREIIKVIQENILKESKSFIIKNKKLILEKENTNDAKSFFDEELKKSYIKNILNKLDSLAKIINPINKQEEEFKEEFEKEIDEIEKEVEKNK